MYWHLTYNNFTVLLYIPSRMPFSYMRVNVIVLVFFSYSGPSGILGSYGKLDAA